MSSRTAATAAAACALLLVATSAVSAERRTDTRIQETGVTASTVSTAPLTPTERARARAWELSETQWRRYRQLMQGIRGSISPAVSGQSAPFFRPA